MKPRGITDDPLPYHLTPSRSIWDVELKFNFLTIMDIQEFVGIAVVGTLLSLLVQALKNKLGTTSLATKFLTVVLAIVVGGLYVWLRSTPAFQTVITVLTVASTVYALFIKE
jgi:hypothetical protein